MPAHLPTRPKSVGMPLIALALTLLFAVAGTASAQANIASVASQRNDLRTLTTAVLACPPLASAASDVNTAVTVFAPSDQAFATALADLRLSAADLLNNQGVLCGLLQYHILPIVARSSDVPSTATSLPTLLTGSNVTVQQRSGHVIVNDARVTNANIVAGRSIIHVVDRVLLPPTIAGVGSRTPALATLLLAARASPEVWRAVSSPLTSVTLFAPTNEAFAAALVSLGISSAQLLANPSLLTRVLRYHIVPSIILSSAATATPVSVTTAEGSTVTLQLVNGAVQVNNARVIAADVRAGLSVVHVINQVLLPPGLTATPAPTPVAPGTIAAVASGNADLSTLVAAVLASPSVRAAATNPATQVTVFAPTNAAFQALLDDLNLSASQLLANERLLTAVLKYHIVPQVIRSSQITRRVKVETLLDDAELRVERDSRGVVVNGDTRVIVADVPAGLSVVHVVDKVLLPPAVRVLLGALGFFRNLIG